MQKPDSLNSLHKRKLSHQENGDFDETRKDPVSVQVLPSIDSEAEDLAVDWSIVEFNPLEMKI